MNSLFISMSPLLRIGLFTLAVWLIPPIGACQAQENLRRPLNVRVSDLERSDDELKTLADTMVQQIERLDCEVNTLRTQNAALEQLIRKSASTSRDPPVPQAIKSAPAFSNSIVIQAPFRQRSTSSSLPRSLSGVWHGGGEFYRINQSLTGLAIKLCDVSSEGFSLNSGTLQKTSADTYRGELHSTFVDTVERRKDTASILLMVMSDTQLLLAKEYVGHTDGKEVRRRLIEVRLNRIELP